MWTRIEPGHPYGEPRAVAVDNNGNLYVAGSSYGTENVVYTTIKYTQTPEGVKERTLGAPRTFALRQNYPNPFNPTTRLSFVLSHSSLVTLKVYDILGKEVATLLSHRKYAIGSYEVPFDASKLSTGVYFYKLEAEDVGNSGNSFTQVKKMVLMK